MKKTIYYSDPLQDDFAITNGRIPKKSIDADYRYTHRSLLWRASSFVLYRLIVTPLVLLIMKLFFGLKIRNRKALRGLKHGYFLYGNHTNGIADSFMPALLSFPKKASIVTAPDAASIPLLGKVVEMLGAMPLPSDYGGMKHLISAMKSRLRHQTITIYPEAHLWPFYNGIRPFTDKSFQYPLMMNAPTAGFVITYRQRKLLRSLPPLITVTVSDVIYPEEVQSRKELRDRIYDFMCRVVREENSYAYIEYKLRGEFTDENSRSM